LDTITSFMVAYEVNGIAGIPYSWNGSLAPQDTTSVQIGNFMPLAKGNSLKVYTYLPNGSKDQFTLNDTLSTEVFACDSVMHGMYSIGATGDFATIYEAIQAVEHCGISASVVFEIENGTYTQGLAIGAIQGVNDSTTITFTSQSRNASDVIINVGHTALRLIDAAHLNFEYITIYGSVIGVEFVETCENIEFYRCTLATNTSSDHSSYRAVNYANTSGSGHYLKDVRFIGNTISGGYYNMYLYYASSSTSDMSKCLITIDSNTLVDAYCYGIYATYSKHTGISHNTITLRASSATQYGIYTNYTTLNDGMIGNKIQLNSSTTSYGIRLYYINAYAANGLAVVANNEVVHNGSGGTSYGMYCYYNNAYIYHNTVYLIGSNTSYPLYIGIMSSSYQMIIKNNIFATYSSGTAYPIYTGTATYVTQAYGTYLDYNNYYSFGPNVGYVAAAITSLSALQSATGQDKNSISLNPNFISTTDLRLTSYSGFECPRFPEVQRDIQNYLRLSITNMGAYVRDPADIDVALSEFIGFSTAFASGSSHPVYAIVQNAGFNPLTSATISGQVNGINFTPVAYTPISPLLYGDMDTVLIGSFAFPKGINTIMAAVSLTGDTIQDNDTIKDSRYMCASIMGGEYVIGPSATADYPTIDSLYSDVQRCGIIGDITMKFESGTYVDNWDFTNLSSIMGNHTLILTSLSGDRDSVTLKPASGVAI
jgi:hypothetical protein